MTVYVPFNEIHLLEPFDVVTFSSPYGAVSGWVDHVGNDYIAIFNGTGPWRIDAEHMKHGLLVKPEGVHA
jgi:hypothetical protein